MLRKLFLPLAAAALAAGCGTAIKPQTRAEATKPEYNLAGYPPAVREGYIDGCETAKRSRYAKKDAARFENDPQYSMGWKDGHSICARKG